MEDHQNGRLAKQKMEYDQNGTRLKWKTPEMEDEQKWKKTKMEDDQHHHNKYVGKYLKKMHNSGKCLKLVDPPISLWEQN